MQAVNSRLSPVSETRVNEAQRYQHVEGADGTTSAYMVLTVVQVGGGATTLEHQ